MNLLQQLQQSLWHAPYSIKATGMTTIKWSLLYLLVGALVFGTVTWLLLSNSELIKQALLDYFFPTSWHEISIQLLDFLYESQAKIIIGNIILGASLVFASIFLFPIKEAISASFEKDAKINLGPSREFPLLMQAWEELKLLLLYVTAQLVILWLGYYPIAALKNTAIVLSYVFLFFTFGLDFIAPTLQRHQTRYSLMIKTMLKHPVMVMSFGALFSLPAIFFSQYLFTIDSLTLIETAGFLFIFNLFLLVLAVPAGTYLAWQLMPAVKRTLTPSKDAKRIGYSLLISTFLVMSFLHGKLINSLHLKSQILKAEYAIDWDSINFNLPTLKSLLKGKSGGSFAIDMTIHNPTSIDLVLEESFITIEKQKKSVARVNLSGFSIPAGQSRKVKFNVNSVANFTKLKNLGGVFEGWQIDLTFELWPGIPFSVNLLEATNTDG